MTDSSGNPVNTPQTITFRICDSLAASCATPLWTETQSNVPVTDGLFSVQLGSVSGWGPSLFTGPNAYLEVQVGSEILSPRKQLVESPYAANADLVQGRDFSLIYTDTTTARVGIGTVSPGQRLDVTGGSIRSDTGFCIGSSCVTSWPAGGSVSLQSSTPGTPQTGSLNITGAALIGGNLQVGSVVVAIAPAAANNAYGFGGGNASAAGSQNVALGPLALGAITSASNNVAVGGGALGGATNAAANVALGYQALNAASTPNDDTAVGYQALQNDTANNNTAVGYVALQANTSGNQNTALGVQAMQSNETGGGNTAVGQSSLATSSNGQQNTAVGAFALANDTAGQNTAVGYQALQGNVGGSDNVAVGYYAGDGLGSPSNTNAGNYGDVFIGYGAGPSGSALLSNAAAIGYDATVSVSNAMALGGTGSGAVNVGIGTSSPAARLDVHDGSIVLSSQSVPGTGLIFPDGTKQTTAYAGGGPSVLLQAATPGTQQTGNLDISGAALIGGNLQVGSVVVALPTSVSQAAYGFGGGNMTATGISNLGLGSLALSAESTGIQNTAVGPQAMASNTTGTLNTAVGQSALATNSSSYQNTAVGGFALANTTSGSNTAIGAFALDYDTTGGQNTAVGYYAGFGLGNPSNANTTGSNNTFIGYGAGPTSSAQVNNSAAIGYYATVSVSNAMVLGGTGSGAVNVGIGTSSPAARLDVHDGGILLSSSSVSGTGITFPDGTLQTTAYSSGAGASLPTATMIDVIGNACPSGFLALNGQVVSISSYQNLYNYWQGQSLNFNTGGEGTGNFRLPNLSRRVAVGAGGASTSVLCNSVGCAGGEESHTLTVGEIPSHTHNGSGTTSAESSNLLHDTSAGRTVHIGTPNTGGGYGVGDYVSAGSSGVLVTNDHTHTYSFTTDGGTGGNGPHNNMQPSFVVLKCVKY